MRFVAVKSADQQALLAVHRARAALVKARTAQVNQIRGLLGESGIVVPQGTTAVRERTPRILEDGENALPPLMRALLDRLQRRLRALDNEVLALEAQIVSWHRQNEKSRRLADIPGLGPITASALVASVGDARSFASARQFAAWLGLTPRQHSTGGKPRLLGISKRGSVMGSRSADSIRAGGNRAHAQAECMAAILTCSLLLLRAWQTGASM